MTDAVAEPVTGAEPAADASPGPSGRSRLALAAAINSGMIVASSATGGLSADLFQVFAIEVVGVTPAVVGIVLAVGSTTFLAQAWYARRQSVARDAANVRRGLLMAAIGSLVICLAAGSWGPVAVRTGFLLIGFLVVELGISLFWVAGWWPLVTRAVPAALKPVPRVRLATKVAALVLYLVIGVGVGRTMSGSEGVVLMVIVAAYFLGAGLAIRRLDPDRRSPPPTAPAVPDAPAPRPDEREPTGSDRSASLKQQVWRYVVPVAFLGPALLTTFLVVRFDATPQEIGLLLSTRTAGGIVGSMVVASLGLPPLCSFRWGLVLGGVGTLAIAATALAPDAWVAFALVGGVGLSLADAFVGVAAIEQATATLAPADRGRFFLWQDAILTCTTQGSSLVLGLLLTAGRAGTTGYVTYLALLGLAVLVSLRFLRPRETAGG